MKYDVFSDPEFKADCERDQIEYDLNRKDSIETREPLNRRMCREFKEKIEKKKEIREWINLNI